MGATISSSTYPIQLPDSKLYRLTIENKDIECIEIFPLNVGYDFNYSKQSDIDALKVVTSQIESLGTKKYGDIPKDLFCKAMDYSARGLTSKFIYKINDSTRFFMLAPSTSNSNNNELIKNEMFCITAMYLKPEHYELLYDSIVEREKKGTEITDIAEELRSYVFQYTQYIKMDIDPYDSEVFGTNPFFNANKTEINIPQETNYLMYFIIAFIVLIVIIFLYKKFVSK